MENAIPKVRFVKCPKCLEILTEFEQVPVYKCGGCGAILRAKGHGYQKLSTDSANSGSQKLPGRFCEMDEVNQEERQLEEGNKVNVILESSDEVEYSSVSMEHNSTTSEEDMISIEFHNDASFRKPIRSLHAYDGSISSTEEDMRGNIPHNFLLHSRSIRKFSKERPTSSCDGKQKEQDESFVSEDFCSAASLMNAKQENKLDSEEEEEDEDQVNILKKVDELRDEISELFNKTANHFQGKLPPKQYHSLPIPFSRQPKPFHFPSYPRGQCCQEGSCKPCHMSEVTRLHGHIKDSSSSLQLWQQNLKDSKPQAVLRHCRPVSGGAPFAICNNCYKLLQLPADFLVWARRVHKIRCGACSEVLEYYFRPKLRSPPWVSPEFHLPPSENSEADHSVNLSRSFGDHMVEEEVGVVEQARGSQLHKLMGYSSASELLFQTRECDYGSESTEPEPCEEKKWRNS